MENAAPAVAQVTNPLSSICELMALHDELIVCEGGER
jgi:hypothetical protein